MLGIICNHNIHKNVTEPQEAYFLSSMKRKLNFTEQIHNSTILVKLQS